MAQAYAKLGWQDNAAPDLSGSNLDHMDQGVFLASAPLVTALPANPVDGQECNFLADAANGVVWHLIYRAADTSGHRWLFTGGSPLTASAADVGFGAAAQFVWTALATPLQIAAPLAGDYMVTHCFNGYFSNMGVANPYIMGGVSINGAAPAYFVGAGPGFQIPANQQTFPGRDAQIRCNGVNAGSQIQAQYYWAAQAAPSVQNRLLSVVPVRVG